MEKVQSRNDYYDDDDDGEDNDLESAAVAERLIQSGSPGIFQAVEQLGNVFVVVSLQRSNALLEVSGAAAAQ